MAKVKLHPKDTGLYSNIPLGPVWFERRHKNEMQKGWDIQYHALLQTFFKKVKTPYAIYMPVGSIDYFDDIDSITPTASKQLIDEKGLKIYLCDSLSTYEIGVESYTMYVEYESTDNKNIRSQELDSISEYVKRNKIKNVEVYVPNYGVEHVFSSIYPELKLMCSPAGWIYPATINIQPNFDLDTDKIKKHFWCGNWRYATHRHFIASYIASKHLETTNLSWLFESSEEKLRHHSWFNLEKLQYHTESIIDGANKLDKLAPLSMGIEVPNKIKLSESAPFIHIDTNPAEYYKESFCAIVTESRFAEPTGLLTEKIMNAILNYRPFIMVGPPGNLKYMKRWGFETYGDFWDESYDEETCHYMRLVKVFDLIDDIAAMSNEKLKELHNDMNNVLLHNYSHILNLQEDLLAKPITKNKVFRRIRYAD